MSGFSGDNSISTIPISSDIYRILFQDSPPSIDLNNPLSLFDLNGCPIAAA